MRRGGLIGAVGFLLAFGCSGAGALAAGTYEFDAVLSLTGNCSVSKVDPVADPPLPECSAGPHPLSGPFINPRGVAVDAYGNRYVSSYGKSSEEGTKGRIDIFDSSGLFITELVIPTGPRAIAVDSEGNLYVREFTFTTDQRLTRYEPKVYNPVAGEIEYETPGVVVVEKENPLKGLPLSSGIAINAENDHVFVDYEAFVAEFSSAKEGNKLLDSTIGQGLLQYSKWIALDPGAGRIYASDADPPTGQSRVRVLELAKPHALLETIEGPSEGSLFLSEVGELLLAVDETTGDFFVGDIVGGARVFRFSGGYEYLETIQHSFAEANPSAIAVDNGPSSPTRGYLHVTSGFNSTAHDYVFAPPSVSGPPEVESVSVGEVGESDAELQATINPNGAETHYVFEYTTQQGFEEEEGFAGWVIAGEGQIPSGSEGVQVSAPATGLAPGTAYRFRVIAENECEPEGCGDQSEGTFSAYPAEEELPPCPNDSLRTRFSALLPDCRAYELVSPPDTNGRAPRGVGFVGARFATLEASPFGTEVSFLTEGGSLPGTEGAGGLSGDPYLASRGPSGWVTSTAGPSGSESETPAPGSVSPDQGYSFWGTGGSLDQGSAVIDNTGTTYVRYPDGHSALIGRGALAVDPEVKGNLITLNGAHIVFTTMNDFGHTAVQLEENAPSSGTTAVYDRTADEVTHVVSLLPGEVTPAADEDAKYEGASADGSGIAFSIGSTLYLRHANAETFEIASGTWAFAGVSEGGARIFYLQGGNLFAFDVATEATIPFTGSGDVSVVNVSAAGTRAYFISPSVLTGAENPGGEVAQVGAENLYLSEEGEVSFVGTVTERDVEGETTPAGKLGGLGLWIQTIGTGEVAKDPSRTTPDGEVLLFESRASLTGYDSDGYAQVYRYDSVANSLVCLSCNPTQMAARSDASLQSIAVVQGAPPPFGAYGFVPNLRADGRRVFFQSAEALVVGDTDGLQDVYEWEAEGVGSCEKPAGCVYLISSGHSAREDFLYGISQSGDDVFFITSDLLLPSDIDETPSIYDARVNGGFPEAPPGCPLAEGCREQTTPPLLLPSANSEATGPSGNLPRRKGCPKGKRKAKRGGKVRCVKKHAERRRRPAGRKGASR
jgi:hypothetical protein